MRSKFIYEDIRDILKPKSQKEIRAAFGEERIESEFPLYLEIFNETFPGEEFILYPTADADGKNVVIFYKFDSKYCTFKFKQSYFNIFPEIWVTPRVKKEEIKPLFMKGKSIQSKEELEEYVDDILQCEKEIDNYKKNDQRPNISDLIHIFSNFFDERVNAWVQAFRTQGHHLNEGIEDILRPKSKEDIERSFDELMKKGEKIYAPSRYFYIYKFKRGDDHVYYFMENGQHGFVEGNRPTKYIYSENKGNIYREHSAHYAKQELRSNSFAFTKGNPNKMAIPNDFEEAFNFILSHYLKKRKRLGLNEGIEDIFKPKSEKEINDSLEEIYDKIAMDLLNNFDFDDYQRAYHFVLQHSKKVKILIKKGYPISDIGFLLFYEHEPMEIVNEQNIRDILKPKSQEEIDIAISNVTWKHFLNKFEDTGDIMYLKLAIEKKNFLSQYVEFIKHNYRYYYNIFTPGNQPISDINIEGTTLIITIEIAEDLNDYYTWEKTNINQRFDIVAKLKWNIVDPGEINGTFTVTHKQIKGWKYTKNNISETQGLSKEHLIESLDEAIDFIYTIYFPYERSARYYVKKHLNEGIEDILRPKSEEEILSQLGDLNPDDFGQILKNRVPTRCKISLKEWSKYSSP